MTRHGQHLPQVEAMLLRPYADYALIPDSTRPNRYVLHPRAGFRCRLCTEIDGSAPCPTNIDCTPACPSRRRCTTEILKSP